MTIHHGVEDVVELRCPQPFRSPESGCTPGKLFAKLRLAGEQPSFIHPDNLIVMACGDCKRQLKRRGQEVFRVLHCYDMAGNLINTLIEPGEQ